MPGMAEGIVVLGVDGRSQRIDGGLVRGIDILSHQRFTALCISVYMGSDVIDHDAVFPLPLHGKYSHVCVLHQLLDIAG